MMYYYYSKLAKLEKQTGKIGKIEKVGRQKNDARGEKSAASTRRTNDWRHPWD